jgi:hypothetical protein
MPLFSHARFFRRANVDRLERFPTTEAVSPFRAVTGSGGDRPGGVLIAANFRIGGQQPGASSAVGNGFCLVYRGSANTTGAHINYCVDIYNTSGKGEVFFTWRNPAGVYKYKWSDVPLWKQGCRYSLCLVTDFGGESDLHINGDNIGIHDESIGVADDPDNAGSMTALVNFIGCRRPDAGSANIGAFDGTIQDVLVMVGLAASETHAPQRLKLSRGPDPRLVAPEIASIHGGGIWSHVAVESASPEPVYSPSYSPQPMDVQGTIADVDRLPMLPYSAGGSGPGSLGSGPGYSP